MNKVWPWIAGIGVSVIILALLFSGTSNRQDYWVARATALRAIEVTRADDITLVRFPCGQRIGSIQTANECGFYVWKK